MKGVLSLKLTKYMQIYEANKKLDFSYTKPKYWITRRYRGQWPPTSSTVQNSKVQYSTVQYSMVQYSTVTGEEDGVRVWLIPYSTPCVVSVWQVLLVCWQNVELTFHLKNAENHFFKTPFWGTSKNRWLDPKICADPSWILVLKNGPKKHSSLINYWLIDV